MSPDYKVINKAASPELFELIEILSDCDSPKLKRILAYAQKLNSLQKNKVVE